MRDPRDPKRDFGLVKVGITTRDIMDRLATLQTGNPYDLILFDCIQTPWPRAVEQLMHRTHATHMLKPEWLRCTRDALPGLVAEARIAADRIAYRKASELTFSSRVSNGRSRRATMSEFRLHRMARAVMEQLVPVQIDMRIAELRLNAASGVTNGIPGIVRVRVIQPTRRFDPARAAEIFPDQAQACQISRVQGGFRWRRVPRAVDFADRYHALRLAEAEAQKVVAEFYVHGARLDQFTTRMPDLEQLHEKYLEGLGRVHLLEGELAELRTELILAIQDYDALDPVCSFIRKTSFKIDRMAFRRLYPAEFKECQVQIPEQIRKYVYPMRAY